MKQARMIFVFLDGVGIGKCCPSNPVYTARARFLPFYSDGDDIRLPGGTPVKAIDATLGVEGIPQSATGQTSLYSGINMPKELGEHKGSYPNRAMRKVLKKHNILSQLLKQGVKAGFINAYPYFSHFFSHGHIDIDDEGVFHFSHEFPHLFKRRISATTCMMIAAGQQPFTEQDIIAEKCIYQDYSNGSLKMTPEEAKKKLRHLPSVTPVNIPEFSPERAAEILFKVSRDYEFLIYEYFQTDIYAHRHCLTERVQLLKDLDRFMGRLFSLLDPKQDTLLLTSDHGNIEDGTSLAHTRNPVPLITLGKGAQELRHRITDLTHVVPALKHFFQLES